MSQPHRSIYEAATACKQCLQQIAELSGLSALAHDEWSHKRLADFNLWISGSGALAKHSLDERLAAQPEVRKVLINVLCLLEVFLGQCQTGEDEVTVPAIGRCTSNDLSESMNGVETIINQLVRISVAIHRSGNAARLDRADQTYKADRHSELRDHLLLLIYANTLSLQEKKAGNINFDVSSQNFTEIQLRLIDGNLRRRHRYLYAQKRLKKYGEEKDSQFHGQKNQPKN
ncbi:hypothetical protein D0Z07_5176 [Hyphodiscus hymeniophilus]|uniref:Uncharacterized protein n=1 Tax=Hyphodiscus hymeniophilus TaxID=353542 RepID=A0A9P7AW64_9HELO|nr:hypothetical protein D0Z07_5176 [Hyphodiscus hymeniophilus]